MHDPDPRPPLLPPPLLHGGKILFSLFASGLAIVGGCITFVVAGAELLAAAGYVGKLFEPGALDQAIVYVVKSIDATLLGLVQFLLAAFLWQMLDPKESLLNEENMERLEEAKQILCKVVLVIVAVRMLSVVITPDKLKWEDLIFPAGIVALSFGNSSLAKAGKEPGKGAGKGAGAGAP